MVRKITSVILIFELHNHVADECRLFHDIGMFFPGDNSVTPYIYPLGK